MARTSPSAVAPAAASAVLVLVAVVAAALAGPLDLRTVDRTGAALGGSAPAAPVTPVPAPTDVVAGPADVPGGTDVAAWVLVAVGVVVAGLLLALLVAALRRLAGRRGRTGTEDDRAAVGGEDPGQRAEEEETLAALRDGVAAAGRELDDDVPPGDAVVAAWVAVEAGAARTGTVRDRTATATEFAVAVLGTTRADPAATHELLGLYLAARFGAEPVTATEVARARDLLAVVARGLGARDAGSTGPVGARGPAGAS